MKTSQLYRIAVACETLGLKRGTVRSAIDRGEIPVETTGCGLPLVRLEDLRKWAAKDRKVGRPSKAD